MSFWQKIQKWMEEFAGAVKRFFSGTVDTGSPSGPVPPEPEGAYPLLVQLTLSKIGAQEVTVGFELDKDGEFVWAIFQEGLPFNKNDVATGSLSSAYGTEAALANEFKSFEVTSLAQGQNYVFALFTKNIEDESNILDRIPFSTSGDAPDIVRFYGDEYGPEYS